MLSEKFGVKTADGREEEEEEEARRGATLQTRPTEKQARLQRHFLICYLI